MSYNDTDWVYVINVLIMGKVNWIALDTLHYVGFDEWKCDGVLNWGLVRWFSLIILSTEK